MGQNLFHERAWVSTNQTRRHTIFFLQLLSLGLDCPTLQWCATAFSIIDADYAKNAEITSLSFRFLHSGLAVIAPVHSVWISIFRRIILGLSLHLRFRSVREISEISQFHPSFTDSVCCLVETILFLSFVWFWLLTVNVSVHYSTQDFCAADTVNTVDLVLRWNSAFKFAAIWFAYLEANNHTTFVKSIL